MIIIESRIKGIKFERHKEESLISSLEEPKEEQSLTFSDFYSIIYLYYNECMLFIRHD